MPTRLSAARRKPALRSRLLSCLWNMYALVYDELLHLEPYRHLLRLVAQHSQTGTDGLICELGCGTGNVLLEIAKTSSSRIVGVEPSDTMLHQTREKTRQIHRITLLQAQAVTGLRSLSDNSVDTFVMCNVLYAIPDRDELWREIARVLAPDGQIVICHSDRGGSLPIIIEHLRRGSWRSFLRTGLYAVALIDAFISFLAAKGDFTFTSFTELQEEMRAAGFDLRFVTRCYGGERRGVNFLATARR